jgi:hypothetical protein
MIARAGAVGARVVVAVRVWISSWNQRAPAAPIPPFENREGGGFLIFGGSDYRED